MNSDTSNHVLLRNADKVDMFLNTPDFIDAWNIAIRVRKGSFAIDYTTHVPRLYVMAKGVEPEIWQQINTRRKAIYRKRPESLTLGLLIDDIQSRLAKLGARLEFVWMQNAQQQKFAKLQIRSQYSKTYVATLAEVKRGQRKAFGEFELTDNW